MSSAAARPHIPFGLLNAAVLASALLLTGCGSTGSSTTAANNPSTPTTSPSQAGSGGSGASSGSSTPGSSSGGTGSGTGSASGSNTGSASGGSGGAGGGSTSGSGSGTGSSSPGSISGTVINAMTGAPVTGKVVVGLESGFGDPTILRTVSADAQGHFRFDSVEPAANGWMIAVSASSSDGSLFAVSYLVSAGPPVNQSSQGDQIVAGTDVGNIAVFPSATKALTVIVTSQDSTGASQDIEVAVNPLRTFTFDRNVQVPWVNVPTPFSTSATTTGCDSQGSCGMQQLQVASGTVEWAVYDHNGNHFQPFTAPNNYSLLVNAHSKSTGDPTCNPHTLEAIPRDSSFADAHFTSCMP